MGPYTNFVYWNYLIGICSTNFLSRESFQFKRVYSPVHSWLTWHSCLFIIYPRIFLCTLVLYICLNLFSPFCQSFWCLSFYNSAFVHDVASVEMSFPQPQALGTVPYPSFKIHLQYTFSFFSDHKWTVFFPSCCFVNLFKNSSDLI